MIPVNQLIPVGYQGSKRRVAPKIGRILTSLMKNNRVYDGCCGSGAITLELIQRVPDISVVMVEIGPWAEVWKLLAAGQFSLGLMSWCLDQIPQEQEHQQEYLQELALGEVQERSLPYIFLILQSASFGGKAVWIEDGKWKVPGIREHWQPKPDTVRQIPDAVMKPKALVILERLSWLTCLLRGKNIQVVKQDITQLEPESPNDLVYIDPPYEGTTGYLGDFDVISLVNRLPNTCCVSEKKALPGGQGVKISVGRSQKSISGSRKEPVPEWVTIFRGEYELDVDPDDFKVI